MPDPELQAHYELVRYLYGAGSRGGAAPLALQGLWPADGGALPAGKGGYRNDWSSEMTYLAYHSAGLADAAAGGAVGQVASPGPKSRALSVRSGRGSRAVSG